MQGRGDDGQIRVRTPSARRTVVELIRSPQGFRSIMRLFFWHSISRIAPCCIPLVAEGRRLAGGQQAGAPARASDASRWSGDAARSFARVARLRMRVRRAGVAHSPARPRNQRPDAHRQDGGGGAAVFGGHDARGRVGKEYLALVRGWPEWDATTVDAPLLRQGERRALDDLAQADDSSRRRDGADAFRGAAARRAARRTANAGASCGRFLRPGRLHQIRVHLAHLGHPVGRG